jgi:hypothetical protein
MSPSLWSPQGLHGLPFPTPPQVALDRGRQVLYSMVLPQTMACRGTGQAGIEGNKKVVCLSVCVSHSTFRGQRKDTWRGSWPTSRECSSTPCLWELLRIKMRVCNVTPHPALCEPLGSWDFDLVFSLLKMDVWDCLLLTLTESWLSQVSQHVGHISMVSVPLRLGKVICLALANGQWMTAFQSWAKTSAVRC